VLTAQKLLNGREKLGKEESCLQIEGNPGPGGRDNLGRGEDVGVALRNSKRVIRDLTTNQGRIKEREKKRVTRRKCRIRPNGREGAKEKKRGETGGRKKLSNQTPKSKGNVKLPDQKGPRLVGREIMFK